MWSEKISTVCRHPNCHCVRPGPSLAQRGVLQLGFNSLDLILRTVGNIQRIEHVLANLNRWLSGLKIRHQTVGNTVWSYLEGGMGEHVVLLHGFGADKDRFGGLGPGLRRSFHVVIPDLPGFGDHLPDWSAGYGIDAQVRRLNRFLKAIGLQEFHLMGISLGGYIAGCYAAHHPEKVRSLCLMDSAGFSSPVPSDARNLFENHNQNIFLPNTAQGMQDMVDYLMYRPVQLPPTLKRYWGQNVVDQFSWRQKMLDDLLDNGLELMDGLASCIEARTLVIWGAQDRICHVSTVANILGMIDHCLAYIIYGCGHIPFVEFPRLVHKIYFDFLRQVDEAPF